MSELSELKAKHAAELREVETKMEYFEAVKDCFATVGDPKRAFLSRANKLWEEHVIYYFEAKGPEEVHRILDEVKHKAQIIFNWTRWRDGNTSLVVPSYDKPGKGYTLFQEYGDTKITSELFGEEQIYVNVKLERALEYNGKRFTVCVEDKQPICFGVRVYNPGDRYKPGYYTKEWRGNLFWQKGGTMGFKYSQGPRITTNKPGVDIADIYTRGEK